MDTLKTAVVVVLLLAVVYGVYVVLNNPTAPVPQEMAWYDQKADEPLQIDMGGAVAVESPDRTPASSPLTSSPLASSPAAASPLTSSPLASSPAASSPLTSSPAGPELPSGLPEFDTGSNLGSSKVTVPGGGQILRAELSPEPDTESPAEAAETARSVDGTPVNPLTAAPSLLTSPNKGPAAPSTPALSPPNPNVAAQTSTQSGSFPIDSATSPEAPPVSADPRSSLSAASSTAAPSTAAPSTPVGIPSLDPNSFLANTRAAAAAALPAQTMNDVNRSVENVLRSATNTVDAMKSAKDELQSAGKELYGAVLNEGQSLIGSGEWYQALYVLSNFYQSPDLTDEQHTQLVNLLDPLAAKVIYSTESITEPEYEVAKGETLGAIAEKYQVPPELLANINGIANPDVLLPGTKLKVVRGPFRAFVDLGKSELTLFAGQLYAGRFPISQGADPAPKSGEFRVQEKQAGRVYYAGDGRTIPVDDPTNPYGHVWIGLGNDVSIHGSPDRGESPRMGCISLSPRDADDVFSILSPGSSVIIR